MNERLFSPKCGKCHERAVALTRVSYSTPIDHDGRTYTITLPEFIVPRCGNCGTIALDEEANRQISDAFRKQAGLLTPEQIRQLRLGLSMTQQDMSDQLGLAVSTLSRWETGAQIQQRALDRFVRAFFLLPQLRRALANGQINQIPSPARSASDG
jgi:putative zinc finger/helix-turn-helix YgiT family protein